MLISGLKGLKELRHDILSCFFFFWSLKTIVNWKESYK